MLRTGFIISLSLHAGVFIAGGYLLSEYSSKPSAYPVVYQVEIIDESILRSSEPLVRGDQLDESSSPTKKNNQDNPKPENKKKYNLRKVIKHNTVKPSNSLDKDLGKLVNNSESEKNVALPNNFGNSDNLERGMPINSNSLPKYPDKARRKHQEGLVLLDVAIDQDGSVKSVELSKSSEVKVLDEAAIEAVKQWRFKPATVNGDAATSRINIPIRFKLK